ncbi:MAG: HD domain-containing protein [bacterium]|nr:HD domain-containing protein [bacterium]
MSITEKVESAIREQFLDDATGHDWYHIQRVVTLSKYIQSKEGGDLEIVELAALLHDISDHKFNGGKLDAGGKVAFDILRSFDYPEDRAMKVKYIVDNISFKGANTESEMNSLEGRIVQDADRLDAIGAIGVGRTFAYGGHKGQPMYDPNIPVKMHDSFEEYANSKGTTINHFHEKLLLLADRMSTKTAQEIGAKRHRLMERFLNDFLNEWEFKPDTE